MLAKATWALDEPNWPQLLPSLIANYNETYHRTIRAKPEAAFKQEAPSGQVLTRAIPDLVVGDRVRLVLKQKNRFTKGETSRLSEKTYLIRRKVGSRWVIAEEDTGLEKPSTYKTKSLRKEGEIWTTPKKEEEKEKEKEEEKSKEKDEEKGEEGWLFPAKRKRTEQPKDGGRSGKRPKTGEGSDQEEGPITLPFFRPRLQEQRRQSEVARAARVVRGQLGDFLRAGPKGDETVEPGTKRQRLVPERYRE